MKNNVLLAVAAVFPLSLPVMGAATIVINNVNAAGVGFNDTTPAAPVGGNTGTTLGQQRLNAFTHAANIWGAKLTSGITIIINAQFTPLTCTATSAVLGSAGATTIHANFVGALKTNTWYSQALANKLSNSDLDATNADINANFNSNLGNPGCLTGTFFYLGLDNNHGSSIDLVTVLLHELGHGLGFQTFTSGSSGDFLGGLPSIWDHFLLDTATGMLWKDQTAAQRAASAIAVNKLVWSGPNVSAVVPSVLSGVPNLKITAPASVAGDLPVGTAAFGPPLNNTGLTGEVMNVIDQANGTGLACTPLNTVNTVAVNGKIAMIDRGSCTFVIKVKNAQNAGAIGVIIADNAPGAPASLTGSDPTITIPSVRITQAAGNNLRAALATRSRTRSGMFAKMFTDTSLGIAGADSSSRPLMFTPNPFQGGSSVSHYDVTAVPNQLMEPAINADLTHSVDLPQDLTNRLFTDIGW